MTDSAYAPWPAPMIRLIALAAGLCLLSAACNAVERADPLFAEGWLSFKDQFIAREGRVIDTANGNISHSEGQGYGMILAVAADDRPAFARLWSWTHTSLAVRPDGLLAWLWKPEANPHIADINNASDGDLLVAWALLRAGQRWNDESYINAGVTLAASLRANAVQDVGGFTLLLPGVDGFVHDGEATVNPSYWVFPALIAMARGTAELATDAATWQALAADGRRLIRAQPFGQPDLPADWLAVSGDGRITRSRIFDPEFGYNAIRVPLHLIWAGARDAQIIRAVHAFWSDTARGRQMPLVTKLGGDHPVVSARGEVPGFLAVRAAVACAVDDIRPDADMFRVTAGDHYFSAALQLLTLLALQEGLPRCHPNA